MLAVRQTVPVVLSSRATCAGEEYRVVDDLGVCIVTVANGCIHCDCGNDHYFLPCLHVPTVEALRAKNVALDAKRTILQELFDPTNYLCN